MKNQAIVGLLLAAIAGALGACDQAKSGSSATTSSGSQTGRTGVTNAQPSAPAFSGPAATAAIPSQLVEQLAEARCEQARSCDEVGAGRRYSAFFECLAQARGWVRADLGAFECPRGIDVSRTQPCVAELEHQDCTHDVVTLLSLAQCGSDVLCAK